MLSEQDAALLDALGERLRPVAAALRTPGQVDPERADLVWPADAALRAARFVADGAERDPAVLRSAVLDAVTVAADCAVAARGSLRFLLEHVVRGTGEVSPGLGDASLAALQAAFKEPGDLLELDPAQAPLTWLWRSYVALASMRTTLPALPEPLRRWRSGGLGRTIRAAHAELHDAAGGSTSPHSRLHPYKGGWALDWADAAEAFAELQMGPSVLRSITRWRLELLERDPATLGEALRLGRQLDGEGSSWWLVHRGPLVLVKHKRHDEALALVEELLDRDLAPDEVLDLEKRRDRLRKRAAPKAPPRSRPRPTSGPVEATKVAAGPGPGEEGRHPLAEPLVASLDADRWREDVLALYAGAPLHEVSRFLARLELLDDPSFEAAVRRVEQGLRDGEAQHSCADVGTVLAERWDTGPARAWRLFELDLSVVNGALAWRMDLPLPLYRALLRRPAHRELGRTVRPSLHRSVAARAARAKGWLPTTLDLAPAAVLTDVLARQGQRVGPWHVVRLLDRCADDLSRSAAQVLEALAAAPPGDSPLRPAVEQARDVAADRSRPLSDLRDLAAALRREHADPPRPAERETDEPPDEDWLRWVRLGPRDPRPLFRREVPWEALLSAHQDQPLPVEVLERLVARADLPRAFAAALLGDARTADLLRDRLGHLTPALARTVDAALRDTGAPAADRLRTVGALVLVPVPELLAHGDADLPAVVAATVADWYDWPPSYDLPVLPGSDAEVRDWQVAAVRAGLLDERALLLAVWPREALLDVLGVLGRAPAEVDSLAVAAADELVHEGDDHPGEHEPCGTSFVRRQWPAWQRSLSELVALADEVEGDGLTDDQALAAGRREW